MQAKCSATDVSYAIIYPKIKIRISNGPHVKLTMLGLNVSDPDYESRILSQKYGNLAMAGKPKAKLVK